jgi:UDP-N-acetylglucosamine acyltransferase
MSRINMDVLPYMIMEGHPARCYGPNVVGLTRSGFSKEAIARIRRMFKLIYRSGLNTSQAVAEIENTVEDCAEKNAILGIIRDSRRGVSR